jgi:hypothetical protein
VKLSYRINIYHVDTVSIDVSISILAQAYWHPSFFPLLHSSVSSCCTLATMSHRQDFTLVHNVWPLDYSDKHPGVNAVDLGKALADHINGQRANDQVLFVGNIRRDVQQKRQAR